MRVKDIPNGTIVTAPDQPLNLIIVRKDGQTFLAEEKDGKIDTDFEPIIPVQSEESEFDIHFEDWDGFRFFVMSLELSSAPISFEQKLDKCGRSEWIKANIAEE